MKICYNCQNHNDDDCVVCPKCGAFFSTPVDIPAHPQYSSVSKNTKTKEAEEKPQNPIKRINKPEFKTMAAGILLASACIMVIIVSLFIILFWDDLSKIIIQNITATQETMEAENVSSALNSLAENDDFYYDSSSSGYEYDEYEYVGFKNYVLIKIESENWIDVSDKLDNPSPNIKQYRSRNTGGLLTIVKLDGMDFNTLIAEATDYCTNVNKDTLYDSEITRQYDVDFWSSAFLNPNDSSQYYAIIGNYQDKQFYMSIESSSAGYVTEEFLDEYETILSETSVFDY